MLGRDVAPGRAAWRNDSAPAGQAQQRLPQSGVGLTPRSRFQMLPRPLREPAGLRFLCDRRRPGDQYAQAAGATSRLRGRRVKQYFLEETQATAPDRAVGHEHHGAGIHPRHPTVGAQCGGEQGKQPCFQFPKSFRLLSEVGENGSRSTQRLRQRPWCVSSIHAVPAREVSRGRHDPDIWCSFGVSYPPSMDRRNSPEMRFGGRTFAGAVAFACLSPRGPSIGPENRSR